MNNILYSFRRCPYAMRARLALVLAKVNVQIREIKLSNKPSKMLEISAKGTVPILQLNDGTIIDESLDIMSWAHDVNNQNMIWQKNHKLVEQNDIEFKQCLDRYKYFERYNDLTQIEYRQQCLTFISKLESILNQNKFLLGDKVSFIDVAIMPFIRQFVKVDEDWFNQSEFKSIKRWLYFWLNSYAFKITMQKFPLWQENSKMVYLL